MESKFSILDDVRNISMGNDLAPTLSISVGVNGGSYIKTYESARMAMDLALGRGGDQAVVRDGETISYYGGKTQKVEKSTRVKARVKAHAMREIMLTHDKVFVMGHKNPDADCIGAALGIYRLARTLGKKAYIVMDKDCPAIEPIVNGVFTGSRTEDDQVFVTNEEAKSLQDNHSMLVVVDVNIPGIFSVWNNASLYNINPKNDWQFQYTGNLLICFSFEVTQLNACFLFLRKRVDDVSYNLDVILLYDVFVWVERPVRFLGVQFIQ